MGSKAPLGSCGKLLKVLFILLNFLYLLVGLALIAVGSYLIESGNSFSALTGNHFFSGAALLIICGIVVFIITAVGIAGAFFQLKFVLYLYVVVVVIIIILEIVATILGFVYRGTIADTAQDNAVEAVRNYAEEGREGHNRDDNNAVDFVQRTFDCCGWVNITLWFESPFYENTMMFPDSCLCPDGNLTTSNCIELNDQFVYNRTCDDLLSSRLRDSVAIVGGVGVGFAIAQILPVLLAIGLLYGMHKSSEYVTV